MKHLLSKDMQKQLRQETKYKLIVSTEEKGAVLSPRSPLDNTFEPLNIDLEMSKQNVVVSQQGDSQFLFDKKRHRDYSAITQKHLARDDVSDHNASISGNLGL